MALAANALTTTAALETELGITTGSKTAVCERAINATSAAIQKYCDRNFCREVLTDERVAGYGTQRLLLSRRPLVSIQAVTIEGVTIDSTEYRIDDAEAGILFRRAGWDWTAPYQPDAADPGRLAGSEEKAYLVSYTGGYVLPTAVSGRDLPYDLEQAALIAAVAAYRARGKYSKLVESTVEGEQRPWYDYLLPPNCRALLAPYKRIV